MKRILIFTLLGSLGLHAAIKRNGDAPATEPPAAAAPAAPPLPMAPKVKPEAPKEEAPGGLSGRAGRFLDRLFKKRQGKNGQLELKSDDLAEMLREMLADQGVPRSELKDAGLPELLKKLREKNPNGPGLLPGLGDLQDLLGFQNDAKLAEKMNGQFKELLEGSRPGAAKAAPATLTLRDGKKQGDLLAYATAVQADGWLLTKASEVEKVAKLECQVQGEWRPAKVDRVWKEHDLALLKVEAKDLPTVLWPTGTAPVVGTFVTAVAPAGQDPLALGVVSVAARNIANKGRGYLGVALESDDEGLKVGMVVADGAAKAAGVQLNDRILEIDGTKPDSAVTFTRLVSDRKAGDKVKLKLQRGSEVLEKEIQLGDRASMGTDARPGFDKMSGIGSTVSKRKSEFAAVLQTDLPVEANQCGGPVTDLDGNVIGLMIARSGRIESLVVPSATIHDLLSTVEALKK